ncbi:MAG: hypothetical protein JWM44_632 [Bacilli bacterium]|nr:hypothetical protein [Bacilli bacterium]
MRNIWVIAYQIQLKIIRKPSLFLLLFLVPMLIIFILGNALSEQFKQEDQPVQPVHIAILNQDLKMQMNQFQEYLASSKINDYVIVLNTDSLPSMDQLIHNKEADIGWIIPSGFSEKLKVGFPEQWKIVSGTSSNKNITGQTIIRGFFDQIERNQIEGEFVANNLPERPYLFQTDRKTFIEPIRIKRDTNYTSLQYYSAVDLIMYMLFAGLTTGISFNRERENGTLSRLNSLPIPNFQIVLGILLGNGIIASIQTFCIIIGTKVIFGVDWGNQFLTLTIICSISIVISIIMGTLVAFIVKSSKAVHAILQFIIIFMTFVSGGFAANLDHFKVFAFLEKFTVNYWAVQSLLQAFLNKSFTQTIPSLAVLGCICAGLIVLTLLVYRRVGYHE